MAKHKKALLLAFDVFVTFFVILPVAICAKMRAKGFSMPGRGKETRETSIYIVLTYVC